MEDASGDPTAERDLYAAFTALRTRMEAGLIGRGDLVERLLIGLVAGGHVLIEGAPGLAKTRAVKRLAEGVEASFARVQCTPDLMPSDVTGTPIFRPDLQVFEFAAGPVFHNLLLVDEINRAPPKVQSALLEAMAEGQVTAGGETHLLPDPFLVVATLNPIEHEGTFPLPEAQLDRFMLHVMVAQPSAAEERRILDLVEEEGASDSEPNPPPTLFAGDVIAARRAAAKVYLAPALKDYIVSLTVATRDGASEIGALIEHPVSPRGALALAAGARARAWLAGRDHATPDDVATLAGDALAHRMAPTWRARADGETARGLVARILSAAEPL